jgi:hypothetical protein
MSICTRCGWPHNVIDGRCEECAGLPERTSEPPYQIAAFRRAVRMLVGVPVTASDQEAIDALMGIVAEAGLWRAFCRSAGSLPDDTADLLRWVQQTVHRAHHDGPLDACTISTCRAILDVLARTA